MIIMLQVFNSLSYCALLISYLTFISCRKSSVIPSLGLRTTMYFYFSIKLQYVYNYESNNGVRRFPRRRRKVQTHNHIIRRTTNMLCTTSSTCAVFLLESFKF